MRDAGLLLGVRVTHRTGTVDDIAAVGGDEPAETVSRLCERPAVTEAFALTTCNRAERYVVAADRKSATAALEPLVEPVDGDAVVWTNHEESLEHLLRVTAGLESVVLGEDEIMGQFRDAVSAARAVDGIGTVLEPALTKAIRVGERARDETTINEGTVSLASATVDRAAESTTLESATVLLVGAGDVARRVARHLAGRGVDEIHVVNRSPEAARSVLDCLDAEGTAAGLEALDERAPTADLIVAATAAPDPILGPEHVAGPATVFDLGQPRDVDPAVRGEPDVTLQDLDDLEDVTHATRRRRSRAAEEVETIVEREHARLLEGYKRARADAVIAAMYEGAERIKERELATAISRFEGTPDEAERGVLEDLADALVRQLLAPPTRGLREAAEADDWATIHAAIGLFDPDLDDRDLPSSIDANTTPGGRERDDEAGADDESSPVAGGDSPETRLTGRADRPSLEEPDREFPRSSDDD